MACRLSLLLVGLLLSAAITQARRAAAEFNSEGVTGFISFAQQNHSAGVQIEVNLTGLQYYPNKWHVHDFPVVEGCGSDSTGGHYQGPGTNAWDLSGRLGKLTTANVHEYFTDHNITLFGTASIIGRSIVIHKNDSSDTRFVCATINYNGTVKTIKATFSSPVQGYMSFTQPTDNSSAETWVLIDVEYANTSKSTTGYTYHVHVSEVDITTGLCSSTGGHYEPDGVTASCTTTESTWTACQIADLSGRHGTLSIPSTGSSKVFYTDTRLSLSGSRSIGNRAVTIHNTAGTRIACATLAKVAMATFNMEGVSGYIKFQQPSAYDNTSIVVRIHGLSHQPNPWHIHQFPVDAGCLSAITGGHFNPKSVPTYSTCSLSTCQVGDLSGKWGEFTAVNVSRNISDPTVTMFGLNSIVGRSVVIHKAYGTRWVCATIDYTASVYTYKAVFDNTYCGSVTFQQHKGDSTSDTSVLVDMENCQTYNSTASYYHNYHVHTYAVDEDSSSRCTSTSGHWNPVSPSGNCSTSLSSLSKCEIGDLSGKHGQLSIPSTGASKLFYTDLILPLSGDWSIANRSVVIHAQNSGSSRIDCATIDEVASARTVYAKFDQSPVSGHIKFYQASSTENVTISVSLTGLEYGPNPWHIHVYPVETDCSASSTGGHWNPKGVSSYTTCSGSSCQAGDLSGQFGKWNSSTIEKNYTSSYITLFGAYSIMGKSVVIHKSDNTRWVCATIGYPFDVKTVKATFDDGLIQGTITMKQDKSNHSAETTVLVDVKYVDASMSSTSFHNYHVHTDPINYEASSFCDSTGGHWNPYNISTLYCGTDPSKWTGCEVGDLAGKHGTINISSTASKVFYTDTNLPLSGAYSVAGRSIVIHAANKGSSRIACATLGKVARVYFSDVASGYFEFMQPSDYDETTVTARLSSITGSSIRWLVSDRPSTDDVCHESVYNPDSTSSAANCYDQLGCPVGALYTKFGNLSTANSKLNATDRNLPLSGSSSVIGRMLVLGAGDSVECASISLMYNITTVYGHFNSSKGVNGSISFYQATVDHLSDTWVIVDVVNASGSRASVEHYYHVHDNAVTGGSCNSAGAHYNPYSVSTACSTSESVWPSCQVADLSGKHGLLNITSTDSKAVFFTDTNLPLTGTFNISGRSVVIHAANKGSAKMDCATLYTFTEITGTPTPAPTSAPLSVTPTGAPTGMPTGAPTGMPTGAPTGMPTGMSTAAPTIAPTSVTAPVSSSSSSSTTLTSSQVALISTFSVVGGLAVIGGVAYFLLFSNYALVGSNSPNAELIPVTNPIQAM